MAPSYTIHRPSQCNLKFPKDNRPIHKKITNPYEGKEVIEVTQNGRWRKMIVPKHEKTLYPVILPQSEYDRLKEQSKVLTNEEILNNVKLAEANAKKIAEEEEQRKALLKKLHKKQIEKTDVGEEDEKPDQSENTLKRAEALKSEDFQGARIANSIILASKCHALRDAQVLEKSIIKKELEAQDKRLDCMMDAARVAALKKEEEIYQMKKARRLENINNVKQQILDNEKSKLKKAQCTQKENNLIVQENMSMMEDEQEKLKKKRETAQYLKALLDKSKDELRHHKEMQDQEDRAMSERIKNFMKYRQEREARIKAEAQAVKDTKEKGKMLISKAQTATKELRDELERIRNLKIQEDVEREYRMKEKQAAIKKQKDLQQLKIAREQQIADIRRQIALEISKDEKMISNVVKQNEQDFKKDEQKKNARKDALDNHRKTIIKQINEKERERIELRQQLMNEGIALRMEQERQDKLEKFIIKSKIEEMRSQKIPETYISEVEHRLAKLKYC